MCGRFVVAYTLEELKNFLNASFSIFDLDEQIEAPRYNIAPGEQVLSIISDGTTYRAGHFKWGFIPSYANDITVGYKLINTRSETITKKTAFKDSFKNKRCLIIASGFYEWEKRCKDKIPMLFQLKSKKLFVFAGLYSRYKDADNKVIDSCTIITTHANELVRDIHDRMPVILTIDNAKKWLDYNLDTIELTSLLKEFNSTLMTKHRVSQKVNKASYKNQDCIKEVYENTLF